MFQNSLEKETEVKKSINPFTDLCNWCWTIQLNRLFINKKSKLKKNQNYW